MNKLILVCGFVFLITLLSVKVVSSSRREIEQKLNKTLKKVSEFENGPHLEVIKLVKSMSSSGYYQLDTEIMENNEKTYCRIIISEVWSDYTGVSLHCGLGTSNYKIKIISLI